VIEVRKGVFATNEGAHRGGSNYPEIPNSERWITHRFIFLLS